MKKRTFILLGLLLIAVCTFAQVPEWQWAAKAGGIEWDNGWSITIDTSGNLYITGWFRDSASFGSNILTSSGGDNIFVAKISSDGNWLWANSVGGSNDGWGCSITVNTSGSLYFTGGFEGTANFGSTTLTSSGSGDIFVAKLNTNLSAENEIIPTINSLSNHPNPFNPTTTISFFVAQTSSFVTLDIYNIKGQLVKTLVNEVLPAGEHSAIWNGRDSNGNRVSSGIYFYKLKAGDYQKVRKMILIK